MSKINWLEVALGAGLMLTSEVDVIGFPIGAVVLLDGIGIKILK